MAQMSWKRELYHLAFSIKVNAFMPIPGEATLMLCDVDPQTLVSPEVSCCAEFNFLLHSLLQASHNEANMLHIISGLPPGAVR